VELGESKRDTEEEGYWELEGGGEWGKGCLNPGGGAGGWGY
jgi:hypothetical protein